ncbi:CBS domain-containing protein [Planomonospora sp. ID82291]|uniref:CBS domain-containing protein n=1 Tax=Planomonospora sp. ID82291 TaxID=2738136 RepID=UPI001A27B3B8|nr:CBS domain-containing protein [Planomonospora sp. ID82291]MBG0817834.1 CBS domain-containing protein [Planomonospora sp. ID82291]
MSIEVRDVMGRVAIAVRLDATFAEIIAAMKRFAVGAVAVVDADRRPVGVVSEDDLLLKEVDRVRPGIAIFGGAKRRQEQRKAAGVTAAELMTSPAITVTPGAPVRDAARLMHDRRIKQLPVIDPVTGRIIGTVHQRDLLRVFSRPMGEVRAEIDAVVRDVAGLAPDALSIEVRDGVVTVGGVVERTSQIARLVEAIGRVPGVVAVVPELVCPREELAVTPPLY